MKSFFRLLAIIFIASLWSPGFSQTLINENASIELDSAPSCIFPDCASPWELVSGSPFLFNPLNSPQAFSNPANAYGWQQPFDDSSYVSIITYEQFGSTRYFVGSTLLQPINPFDTVEVSFWISRADSCAWATNNIGILFSKDVYLDTLAYPASNTHHVKVDTVVSDTANWVNVRGEFVSTSVYDRFEIGNQYWDTGTQYVLIDSAAKFPYTAVYYVDLVEIKLRPYGPLSISEVSTDEYAEELFKIYDDLGREVSEQSPGMQFRIYRNRSGDFRTEKRIISN